MYLRMIDVFPDDKEERYKGNSLIFRQTPGNITFYYEKLFLRGSAEVQDQCGKDDGKL
jgi:hypothetical protein